MSGKAWSLVIEFGFCFLMFFGVAFVLVAASYSRSRRSVQPPTGHTGVTHRTR